MYSLVDGDSYFANCHAIFRPDLRGKAVIVLSLNDGAIVSMTPAAAALGIPKFQPYFKVKHIIDKNDVAVFSSNFPLYGDICARVLATLSPFASDIEPYSVDENFLLIPENVGDLVEYGHEIKRRLWDHVRVPVCVGTAPTKTLAKLANKAAKKIPSANGVAVLDAQDKWEWVLKRCKVTDVWGVGKQLGARLSEVGIHTAYELAKADPKFIRKRSSIILERTVEELNGKAAFELEQNPPSKKQIYVTRSFGAKTSELDPILEAVSGHASMVADKARRQNHLAIAIHVFIQTSAFNGKFHNASDVVQLPYPTNDNREIVGLARNTAMRLYERGKEMAHIYAKAGVGAIEMVDKKYFQYDLLHGGQSIRSDELMKVLDDIKAKQGKDAIFIGAQGVAKKTAVRQEFSSPAYTTMWSDTPIVKC